MNYICVDKSRLFILECAKDYPGSVHKLCNGGGEGMINLSIFELQIETKEFE